MCMPALKMLTILNISMQMKHVPVLKFQNFLNSYTTLVQFLKYLLKQNQLL